MRSQLLALLLALLPVLGILSSQATLPAQIPEDRGLAGLRQALDRLDVFASVLHTGAHPDDENSALLAWLSRGQGARTAYLSATRGEGGQNLIGNELFEALGVIRTEELRAARRYDRAWQFFTPNYEFGYSKTAEETLEKWGRDALVGDFVRVIRQFRPEVIISRFTGTPSDGHGHHQAAGIATMEAFHAAADPNLYPEYGPPWQAKKLYLSGGGGRGGALGGVQINVGEYGAALGRSYNEIAMEGRSLHRTQSMGAAQNSGPSFTTLTLVEKSVPGADDEPIFSRTTATLMDLARLEPGLQADLARLQSGIDAVRENASLRDPARIFPALVRLVSEFDALRERTTDEHVRFLLDQKRPDFHEAARLAAGLRLEVFASDDTIVPDQEFDLRIGVVNDGPFEFSNVRSETEFPADWDTEYAESTGTLQPGQRFEQRLRVDVGPEPAFTQPYWLIAPRDSDRFVWPAGTPSASLPFDPPLMPTVVVVEYDGTTIEIPGHAEYRYVDEVLGDRRSLVKVVPDISVSLSPAVAVVPIEGERAKEFTVTLRNEFPRGGTVSVVLEAPEGWRVMPGVREVTFAGAGESASVQFSVEVPAVSGEYEVRALAAMGGEEYGEGYRVIAYPHIETRHIYSRARSLVRVFDVETRVRNIGYVEGAGDEVADALRQLGIGVTFLTADDLARGDLSVYDTIVLGIRAYAVRNDLRAHNQRLLDYAREGGTLVVQYNTYQILDQEFGPFPFTINRPHDRVTVEEAAVTFLEPDHPVLNEPNRLGSRDFEGWVQERGLYFMGDWDPSYTAVLASNDPGEEPKAGGLMVAEVGEGYYVYAAYAFFRQLPAGVPGAYRLFANVVSLGD